MVRLTAARLIVLFEVQFIRNPNFVGRDSILLELEKLMDPVDSKTRAAIWGLGGCGKTAVALEFVYRVHDREPDRTIFWVRASDRDRYMMAFRDIASKYNIPGAHDLQLDILGAVKTKLADDDTPRWLIVVDNADDPEFLLAEDGPSKQRLKDYLPSRAGCKVLFTTRDNKAAVQLVGLSALILEVQPFGLPEAQQLFDAIVPSANSASNDFNTELLIELSCLPLAIVQAASYIRMNSISAKIYLDLFRKQDVEKESTDILGREFEDETRYPKVENALTKTWHISFKQLERRDPLAFDCLKHLACLACSDIPENLVMSQVRFSDLECATAVGTLVGYQFLVRQRQGNLLDAHRLVHQATKRWLWLNTQWEAYVRNAVVTLSQKIPHGGYQEYNEYSEYLPHGICLLGHFGNKNLEETAATTDLMSQIAACQRDLGDHNGAEKSHRAVLSWRQMHLRVYDKKTLQSMQDVGQDLMMKAV